MVTEMALDDLINNFIRYKKALGCLYDTETYYLKCFKSMCEERGCNKTPGKAEFMAWLKRRPNEQESTQHTRVSPVKQLYFYMCKIGYDMSFTLPKRVGSGSEKLKPHFFCKDELRLFFNACDYLEPIPETPCRDIILPTAFQLLYCCGLRPIEAIKLKTANVNLEDGYIDILGSKKHKDRRLFISRELIEYLSEYKQKIKSVWQDHEYFFPKGFKGHYASGFLRTNFTRIWKSSVNTRKRVRLYDIRHHFAYANIDRWVREGKNVNSMIVFLSKFMGHASIESTFYYLHLVPDFFNDYRDIVRIYSDILPEVGYED